MHAVTARDVEIEPRHERNPQSRLKTDALQIHKWRAIFGGPHGKSDCPALVPHPEERTYAR